MKSENPTKNESKSGSDSEKTNSPSEDKKTNDRDVVYSLQTRGGRTRCVCRQLEEEEYWAMKRRIEEDLS
jgi:hypothetical protein